MYQLTTSNEIIRQSDGAVIPADDRNKDYCEYREWLDAGNTPEPPPVLSPVPNYVAFWDTLVATSFYAAIREQSFVSLRINTLATELIALLGDAKSGRVSQQGIQQSMNSLLAAASFTNTQLLELRSALIAGHLDGIYLL